MAEHRVTRRAAIAMLGASVPLAAGAAPFPDDGVRDLERRLHAIRRRFGLNRAIGIHVEHLDSGAPLFSHNPDRTYVPASGMKLPVMGACLHYLGPSYRFPTRFYVDAPPDENGVIHGPVHVVGSGDPSFTRHDMAFVADSIAAAGITAIRGGILLDDSFFEAQEDDPRQIAALMQKKLPIQSALGYMWNRVEIAGVPGGGDRPELRDEGHGYFDLDNRMVLRNSGRPYILVQRRGSRRARVQGRILRSGDERVARFTATEPALYFGYAFQGKLEERGITVEGTPARASLPNPREKALLYRHESAALPQVLEALGKYSNNWSAEQLLFTAGAHRWGAPGTMAKGAAALEEYIVGLGFPAGDFRIADGSGLSRENRLSTRILVAIVRDMYRPPELRSDFLCSLAVSGVDGTLARRMRSENTLGQVMAKTGSLSGVSSLSGIAFPHGPAERAIGFSVITNGVRQWSGDEVENRIAAELVSWASVANS